MSTGAQPLYNLRFADDIGLLGGSKEELQQLTERLDTTAGDAEWKSAPTKQNPCQQHQAKAICQHMDEWKSAGRSGPAHTLRINTNERWSIGKGQTGAGTLSHDKTICTVNK